ncbi:hypothetical protein DNTS_022861 [Danionella cerebrum]|uniref:Ig-like domain-containing protein n=1 Tax=Danionella cerebrum TaxID=2873325 RepID=A0A553QUS8_9TELE|nr:hypothetical protein DNTS_022861 [Danionella translucida]
MLLLTFFLEELEVKDLAVNSIKSKRSIMGSRALLLFLFLMCLIPSGFTQERPKPLAKVSPDPRVFRGETVTLTCDLQREDKDAWEYTWFKDGESQNSFRENRIATYSFRSAETRNGVYTCSAQKGSLGSLVSDPLTLTVMGTKFSSSSMPPYGRNSINGDTLTIKDIVASDQKEYWCQAEMEGRSVSTQPSSHLSLTVLASPKSVVNVTPDTIVYSGETVVLKCVIESEFSDWRYMWVKGGVSWELKSSDRYTVNGDTVTIREVAESDMDQFWCRAFVNGRSISSVPKHGEFSVKPSPRSTLTVSPDSHVFAGERVYLKCSSTLGLTDWRFEWFKGSKDSSSSLLLSSDRYSVDADTLSIREATEADQGQYWCGGRRPGRPSLTLNSSSVLLAVNSAKPKPYLESDVTDEELTGNQMYLTCDFRYYDQWDFYWYKNSQSTEINLTRKQNVYLLEINSESDGGQFWCRAGRGKPVFYSQYSNAAWINVTASPKAVVTVLPDRRVFKGEQVSLRCDVKGGGDTEWIYSWGTEGTNQNNQLKNILGRTFTQELNISQVDQSHSGKYFCTGHTGTQRSQSSEAVPLTVIPGEARAALRVSPGPWLTEGDSVTLNCEVPDSSTGWRFSWFRDADLLSDSSRGAGGSYKLSPASLQHTGVYICRAQRGGAAYYTQNSSMELVWVSDAASSPVSLVVSPSRGQHFSFDSLSLSCDSSGWTVRRYTSSNPEDCSSQSGSSCGISSLQESDSGVYWCQSDSGEKRSPLNITVTQEDVILESPAGPVTEGETLTLLCSHRSRSSSILSAAFYKDGSLIQNQTTGEMSIAAVSESDEGFYSCRTEGGASPRSWISVRAPSSRFPVVAVAIGLSGCALLLMLLFLLLFTHNKNKGNLKPAPNQSQQENLPLNPGLELNVPCSQNTTKKTTLRESGENI